MSECVVAPVRSLHVHVHVRARVRAVHPGATESTLYCLFPGVITKVDMAARGTEHDIVRMVSEPIKYKIQKGFVLVKLRSQEDINNHMSLEKSVESEMRYFKEQAHYRCVDSYRLVNLMESLSCQI